jgi:hypothetical protein
VDAEFEQAPGLLRATLTARGPEVRLTFAPALPPGASGVVWKIDAARVRPTTLEAAGGSEPSIEVPLGVQPHVVELTWRGGLLPEAPLPELSPGDSSHALRVLDFGSAEDGWRITVEGDAGRAYELRLFGERLAQARGAEIIETGRGVTRLRVRLPEGDRGTSTAEIALLR